MKEKGTRTIFQVLFFLLVTWVSISHNFLGSRLSLHGICPFGGVETFYNYITAGSFISKIHLSSILMMYIVIILAIILGPVFCGWACPLGSIQEWVGKLGRKLFGGKYNTFVPKKLDKYLRYLRIGVLAWAVYVTVQSATLLFLNVDPFYALFNFYQGEVVTSAVVVLLLSLVLSLFIERPWCKYLCPYGAFLGFFNKIRIFKIKRNESTCISCHRCTSSCPMNIDVEKNTAVANLQCITCLECTSSCPIDDTVELKIGGFKNEN